MRQSNPNADKKLECIKYIYLCLKSCCIIFGFLDHNIRLDTMSSDQVFPFLHRNMVCTVCFGGVRLISTITAYLSPIIMSVAATTIFASFSTTSFSFSGLVPRLTTLSSLHFPVPSPAIPMSPTVTNFLTAPVPAASTSTYIPAPSPASYFGAIPSPATPSQFPIASPATPQTGTPSPAMLAPSPGNISRSPQVPGSTTYHQRTA